jgi:hypothetical protein
MRSRASQQSPGMTAGSTHPQSLEELLFPFTRRVTSFNKKVEPQGQVLPMRLVHVQLGSQYCGLASDPELRTVTAQEANKCARHDNKRIIGAPAETPDQQGDATANAAVQYTASHGFTFQSY